jgi:aryl-alcohol dehydrogenase-like predicted oxidoreductase
MKKITIGQTDLQVAPFNLGGNVFGWTLDEEKSFGILDAYLEAGFNFIDTAESTSWRLLKNRWKDCKRTI